MRFKCYICGWVGRAGELIELAGYLWDYTEHESCPNCWNEHALDSPVIPEYDWKFWDKYTKMTEKLNKERS